MSQAYRTTKHAHAYMKAQESKHSKHQALMQTANNTHYEDGGGTGCSIYRTTRVLAAPARPCSVRRRASAAAFSCSAAAFSCSATALSRTAVSSSACVASRSSLSLRASASAAATVAWCPCQTHQSDVRQTGRQGNVMATHRQGSVVVTHKTSQWGDHTATIAPLPTMNTTQLQN